MCSGSVQVIAGRQYAGPEVDVWSAGCILFALLAGRWVYHTLLCCAWCAVPAVGSLRTD